MPTYTYKCTNEDCASDENFEVTQRMTDDALTDCDTCGNSSLRRVVVPAGSFRIPGEHTGTSMWNCSEDPGPARYRKKKIGLTNKKTS